MHELDLIRISFAKSRLILILRSETGALCWLELLSLFFLWKSQLQDRKCRQEGKLFSFFVFLLSFPRPFVLFKVCHGSRLPDPSDPFSIISNFEPPRSSESLIKASVWSTAFSKLHFWKLPLAGFCMVSTRHVGAVIERCTLSFPNVGLKQTITVSVARNYGVELGTSASFSGLLSSNPYI